MLQFTVRLWLQDEIYGNSVDRWWKFFCLPTTYRCTIYQAMHKSHTSLETRPLFTASGRSKWNKCPKPCHNTSAIYTVIYTWIAVHNADAKKILTVLPREHPDVPRITWMKTVLNDVESHNLTLTEAVNMAQSHPLWRLLAVSGATYS